MTTTFDSLPYSADAETALVSAALINPSAFEEVAGAISPEDFYLHRLRFVWQAVARLAERDLPVDPVTVQAELEDMGRLAEIGGPSAIAELMACGGYSTNAEGYARIVAEDAARRKLIALGSQIAAAAYDQARPLADVLASADRGLATISATNGQRTSAIITAADAVRTAMDATEAARKGEGSAIPTGLVDLDKKIGGGLAPEDLVIVAARSGEGKTALMGTMAANIAGLRRLDNRGGTPINLRPRKVGFFSLEMPTVQVVNRLIAQITGISASRLRNGGINEDEWPAYYQAIEDIGRAPIYFDDTPALTIHALRSKMRKLADQGVEVVFIDQLNFLDAQMDGKTPENIRLNWLSHRLKDMAREYRIPVVLAHQMNRNVENKGEGEDPTLADLDQAGDKPASIVLFIRHKKSGEIYQNSWLYLGKNRDGAAGMRIPVAYLGERTRFENAARI